MKIDDGVFEWSRREDSIRAEEALDGIYIITISEPKERLSPEDAVRKDKSLAEVERAFRNLKRLEILVGPMRHRIDDHAKAGAQVFLCLLAYYLEWHTRKARAPLLFDDEERCEQRKTRDPVAPARPSPSARKKKTMRLSPDGLAVHSFETLLQEFATRCRNPADGGAE